MNLILMMYSKILLSYYGLAWLFEYVNLYLMVTLLTLLMLLPTLGL